MTPPDVGPHALAWRQKRDEAERARAPKPNGAHYPPPPKSEDEYGAIDDSPQQSGQPPDTIAELRAAIAAAKPSRKQKRKEKRAADPRPLVTIRAGEIGRIVDEVEAALIAADRGLYQRAGKVVCVQRVPAIAAGDKPITAASICERGDHALREDMSSAAAFEKHDARADGMVDADPPLMVVQTLKQRGERLRLPVLSGVVHSPAMRADGSLLTKPGYDPATGLLFDPLGVEFPPIPDHPTCEDAAKALAELVYVIHRFDFVTPAHRAVALSGLLTSVCRRALATAPLHAFSAPVRGSGKSKLVDIASVLSTGLEAPVTAAGATDEELEKRLVALMFEGRSIITIDNCSRPIGGDFLCQMLTQATVKPRILGKSETITCPTGAFVAATGNNFVAAGDMERRTIVCKVDPKTETPELRKFDFEPVALAKERRPALVIAALTVLRAYHVAGRPDSPDPLGSFEDWSNLVRGALIWLGEADPIDTMAEVRAADPASATLRQVMAAWGEVFGQEGFPVSRIIKKAMEQGRDYDGATLGFVNEDLHEALLTVASGAGGINSRTLGAWLSKNKDRVMGDRRFEDRGERGGSTVWALANV
jgi:putative DNA primase/helicase